MLKDTFCSSPWMHLRFGYNGEFTTCRWSKNAKTTANIRDTSIIKFYNSDEMKNLRKDLLSGHSPQQCENCYYEFKFDKLSGRIKQLAKSGISMNEFDVTTRSSPHYKHFEYSNSNNGEALSNPVDLQIDLSTICNSGCIMCTPSSSSRLVPDFKKLHRISPELFDNAEPIRSWSEDPVVLDRVIDELISIKNLRYVHLLGGETLFDESFYKICEALISSGKSKSMIIGTTTNGTIYDERLENIIKEFKQFHLGVSLETVSTLNDYVRYPGKVGEILSNIDKFLSLRDDFDGLFLSLRITPNVFTVYELPELFEYMLEKKITAESCYILYKPESLRIENMPSDIRDEVIEKFRNLIVKHNFEKTDIVNVRNPKVTELAIRNLAVDYYNFLKNYEVPSNVEENRYKLVKFLKSFESIRSNAIIDYVPRYAEFLKHYGY